MNKRRYAFAVIDGNQAPDQTLPAESCHLTYEAARRAAAAENRRDPNGHYYVIEWSATRWARLRPNGAHYPLSGYPR
jgi:hypothetical protein